MMYVPIREDLPYKDSIRLDLHDELGRPLAWDKDTVRNHRPPFTSGQGNKLWITRQSHYPAM